MILLTWIRIQIQSIRIHIAGKDCQLVWKIFMHISWSESGFLVCLCQGLVCTLYTVNKFQSWFQNDKRYICIFIWKRSFSMNLFALSVTHSVTNVYKNNAFILSIRLSVCLLFDSRYICLFVNLSLILFVNWFAPMDSFCLLDLYFIRLLGSGWGSLNNGYF